MAEPAWPSLCDWLSPRAARRRRRIARSDRDAARTDRRDAAGARLRGVAINPKQLDRFRDRFTIAGAKDDRRDAQVLGDSLRTDRRAFRPLVVDDPIVIELREWSRIADELTGSATAWPTGSRDQLWRYYPQTLQLGDDVGRRLVPGPVGQARRPRPRPPKRRKPHRAPPEGAPHPPLRRRRGLAHPAPEAALGRPRHDEAASAHITALAARCGWSTSSSRTPTASSTCSARNSNSRGERSRGRDPSSATWRSCAPCRGSEGSSSPRCSPRPASPCAAETIRSCAPCPASLRSPAAAARRASCCAASLQRSAARGRLSLGARRHAARSDARRRYAALRQRGHSHGRALRALADRLLAVACAMLKNPDAVRPQP